MEKKNIDGFWKFLEKLSKSGIPNFDCEKTIDRQRDHESVIGDLGRHKNPHTASRQEVEKLRLTTLTTHNRIWGSYNFEEYNRESSCYGIGGWMNKFTENRTMDNVVPLYDRMEDMRTMKNDSTTQFERDMFSL